MASTSSWCPRTITQQKKTISDIAFSPDGKTAATGGSDSKIHLWDVVSSKLVRTFSVAPGQATDVAFSPNGRFLAASIGEFHNDEKGETRLWDLKTGKLKASWLSQRAMTGIDFSKDSQTLAVSEYGGASLFDVQTKKRKNTYAIGDTFWAYDVVLSPDAKVAVGVGESNYIYWWSEKNKARKKEDYYGDDKNIGGYSADFAPNGKLLAVGGIGEIKIYDGNGNKLLRKFHVPRDAAINSRFSKVKAVIFSRRGTLVAATHYNEIFIWQVKTGKLLCTFKGHRKMVTSIDFSPYADHLVSSSEDGTIKLWQIH